MPQRTRHEWGTRNPTHDDEAVMDGAPRIYKRESYSARVNACPSDPHGLRQGRHEDFDLEVTGAAGDVEGAEHQRFAGGEERLTPQ